MERVLAAELRAERSRKRLSKRYGAVLQSWASARAADWQLGPATSIADVLAKLDRLCTHDVWTPLSGSVDMQDIDRFLRVRLWAFVSLRRRRPTTDTVHELTMGEVSNIVRTWFPRMTRARLDRGMPNRRLRVTTNKSDKSASCSTPAGGCSLIIIGQP